MRLLAIMVILFLFQGCSPEIRPEKIYKIESVVIDNQAIFTGTFRMRKFPAVFATIKSKDMLKPGDEFTLVMGTVISQQ